MKKLIIFDLDDTLIKTRECHNQLMCSIISKKYSISFSKVLKLKKETEWEASQDERTKTKQDFFEIYDELFLEKLKIEPTVENIRNYRTVIDEMNRRFPSEVKLHDNVLEVLQSLKEKGFILAILTGSHNKLKPVFTEDFVSSKRERLLKTFAKTGLNKLINQHFFAWDHKCLKPDRKAFELPLNYFNIDPEDAIMVGDKDKDLLAKELGLTTILFNPKRKYKKETVPDYKVNSFNEILDIIDKI